MCVCVCVCVCVVCILIDAHHTNFVVVFSYLLRRGESEWEAVGVRVVPGSHPTGPQSSAEQLSNSQSSHFEEERSIVSLRMCRDF